MDAWQIALLAFLGIKLLGGTSQQKPSALSNIAGASGATWAGGDETWGESVQSGFNLIVTPGLKGASADEDIGITPAVEFASGTLTVDGGEVGRLIIVADSNTNVIEDTPVVVSKRVSQAIANERDWALVENRVPNYGAVAGAMGQSGVGNGERASNAPIPGFSVVGKEGEWSLKGPVEGITGDTWIRVDDFGELAQGTFATNPDVLAMYLMEMGPVITTTPRFDVTVERLNSADNPVVWETSRSPREIAIERDMALAENRFPNF